MRKTVLTILAASCLLGACKSLLPEEVEIVSLGIVPDSIIVPAGAGEDGVKVLSDRDYKMEIVSGADWLSAGIAERDSLSFSFKPNAGYRRSARLRVSADGREDELLVKQQGPFQEELTLSEHDILAPASGCSVSIRVYSNLPSDYFTAKASNDEVIDKLNLFAYGLTFDVLPTTNRDKRTYTVTVSYTDGWGEEMEDTVTIVQERYD